MQGWEGSAGGTPVLKGRKGMKEGGRERKLCASDSCPFPEPSLNLHPPSITQDVQLHYIFVSAFPHLFHPPDKTGTEAPQLFHENSFFGNRQFFLGSSETFSTKSHNESQCLKEEEHHLETPLWLIFRYNFISVLC